jgi:hypothetical protein
MKTAIAILLLAFAGCDHKSPIEKKYTDKIYRSGSSIIYDNKFYSASPTPTSTP